MSFLQRLLRLLEVGELEARRDVEGLTAPQGHRKDAQGLQTAATPGKLTDAEVIGQLIAALKDPTTRESAADALVSIGPPASDALTTALNDSNVSEYATQVMNRIAECFNDFETTQTGF